MIAPVAVGAGKTTVKSPAVLVLSPPKSMAATALSPCVSLYSSAPRAVIVALLNVRSLKSHTAVVPVAKGVTLVNADPPAV